MPSSRLAGVSGGRRTVRRRVRFPHYTQPDGPRFLLPCTILCALSCTQGLAQPCAGPYGPVDNLTDPRLAGSDSRPASPRAATRARYLTALAPAAEATPSCWPVPPLVPIAPISRPLTIIGMPPSDAIGRASSGKLMKPVLPAANWSANTLLGRRNSAEVRAFA